MTNSPGLGELIRWAGDDRKHLVALLARCPPQQLSTVLKAAADFLPPEVLAAIITKRESRLRAEIAELTKRSQSDQVIWRGKRRACYERGYQDGYILRLHDLPWPARTYVEQYERLETYFSPAIKSCKASFRCISQRCRHLFFKR